MKKIFENLFEVSGHSSKGALLIILSFVVFSIGAGARAQNCLNTSDTPVGGTQAPAPGGCQYYSNYNPPYDNNEYDQGYKYDIIVTTTELEVITNVCSKTQVSSRTFTTTGTSPTYFAASDYYFDTGVIQSVQDALAEASERCQQAYAMWQQQSNQRPTN